MPNASDLVDAISTLRRDLAYRYVSDRTGRVVRLAGIGGASGPIAVRRCSDKRATGTRTPVPTISISSVMLSKLARAIAPLTPFNVDEALQGSYSSRSMLEALLAHTSEFHVCYVSRSGPGGRGHKHLVWMPGERHPVGVINRVEFDPVRMRMPRGATHDTTGPARGSEGGRRHTDMQLALAVSGERLGHRVHIATNDRGAVSRGRRLDELPGIVPDFGSESLLQAYPEARAAGRLIDLIWFGDRRRGPIAFEIEHSTKVTSGLTRMLGMMQELPQVVGTRWIVVAPDEERERVLREARRPQFEALDTRFLPYSGVEFLYDLCRRWPVTGVGPDFIDTFAERCLS